MKFIVAASLLLPIAANADQPATPPICFTCDCIKRLVDQYGEDAVIAEARRRLIPEHIIQSKRKQCLEAK